MINEDRIHIGAVVFWFFWIVFAFLLCSGRFFLFLEHWRVHRRRECYVPPERVWIWKRKDGVLMLAYKCPICGKLDDIHPSPDDYAEKVRLPEL